MEKIKAFFKQFKGLVSVVVVAVTAIVGLLFLSKSSSPSKTRNRSSESRHDADDLKELLVKATNASSAINKKVERNNFKVEDINSDIDKISKITETSDGIDTLKKSGYDVTNNTD
jgi:methyl-accepting chemotaxis protein